METIRRIPVLLGLLLACLSAPAAEPVIVQLKWFHQFQFAGIYAARELGYYADEGLEVEIRPRDPATSHIDDVLEGRAHYGVADAGLVLSRLAGQPVVLLAQVFQHSPLVLLTRKDSGLRTPYDLAGKRVMFDVHGHSDAPIRAMLLDTLGGGDTYRILQTRFDKRVLIDDETDAYSVYLTDQPFWYREHGQQVNVIDPRDYGIDFYGDNLFTTEREVRTHPRRVRAMIRATLKGWEYALAHPDEIIDLILRKYNTHDLSRAGLQYEARETAKMILPDLIPLGSYQPSRFRKIVESYARLGLTREVQPDPGFFLPFLAAPPPVQVPAKAAQEAPERPEADRFTLEPEERAWLADHPVIRVGLDPDWAPLEYLDDQGRFQGMSTDYLRYLEGRLGVRFEAARGMNWQDLVQALRDKRLDMFASVARTPQRESYLRFTPTYLSVPINIFVREEGGYLGDLRALAGKRVAVVGGYAIHDWLHNDHPDIRLQPVQNAADGLSTLAAGEVDAFIGNAATTNYYLGKLRLSGIRAAGETPYANNQAMAVRDDWPLLAGILEKALAAMPDSKRQGIYNRWMSLRYEYGVDYTLVWQVAAGALALLAAILYRNRRLAGEIRRRLQVESELVRARDEAESANRAKSLFLSNMSHELRTPLNAILGFAQLMQRDPALSASQQTDLATINRSGRHLLDLIDEVLEISRIESGHLELEPRVFDLEETLAAVESMMRERAQRKGLTLALARDGVLPRSVEADGRRLRQVLINLVGNAVKYTETGKVVLRVAARPADDRVHFEVEDTGPGIPDEERAHIFDAFFQTREGAARGEGTGLGLAISRRYVALMGGELTVRSAPGRGSRFGFSIPLPRAEQVPEPEHERREVLGLEPGQPAWRVLVAEDQADSRLLLRRLLETAGFEVREAVDGEQAVALFQSWRPHLIWMDMRMPVLDGYQATRRIKATPEGRDTVVLALTASAFEEDRDQVLAAGCDDFVRKPLQAPEIFAAMERHLGVRLRYAERAAAGAAPAPADSAGMEPALASLPAMLREALQEAALTLDVDLARRTVEGIRELDPTLAGQIEELVDAYRFDELTRLTASDNRQ